MLPGYMLATSALSAVERTSPLDRIHPIILALTTNKQERVFPSFNNWCKSKKKKNREEGDVAYDGRVLRGGCIFLPFKLGNNRA